MFVTIFATVISGVLIFVLGQIVVKFLIDPIKELKEILGEIQFSLIFHAQAIYTPVEDRAGEDAAQKVIRDLASKLRAKIEVIPWYSLCSRISREFLPPKKNIMDASSQLIGLSNSVKKEDRSEVNRNRVEKIRKLLHFESFMSLPTILYPQTYNAPKNKKQQENQEL